MKNNSNGSLQKRIVELESRLEETEQLIEAIKSGEVDAFSITANNRSEVYTLQSGDYAYRILVESLSEGAVNVTEDGMIVYTNGYFSDLMGLPYEKVIGTSFYDLIYSASQAKFKDLFTASLKGKAKGEIYLCKGGKVIPVYISLTSLQPRVSTVGIIVSDLTEKKKAEEIILKYQNELIQKNQELFRKNEELASFNFISSHDLQEPLRTVINYSGLFKKKYHGKLDKQANEFLEFLTSASRHMQELINDLLKYSKLKDEQNISKVDCNDLVKEVMEDLRIYIEDCKAEIHVGKLPVLQGFPTGMKSLFQNLISNAIKFRKSYKTPKIEVAAKKLHGNWQFSVKDNGIGIESMYLKKIFIIFQKLHTNEEYSGTGIGLAQCKKIVEMHGGEIWVKSVYGKGSTFYFTMPDKSKA